jgi:hypothetical protein
MPFATHKFLPSSQKIFQRNYFFKHTYQYDPPPSHDLPILQKATDAYLIWHGALLQLPRLTKFTLGSKIDSLFLETIEYLLIAGYTTRERKVAMVQQASAKLDALKFFLKIAWQAKALQSKKYAELSVPVAEIGRMLGGWRKQLAGE